MTDDEKAESVVAGLSPFEVGEDVCVINEDGQVMHYVRVVQVDPIGVTIATSFNRWTYSRDEAYLYLRRRPK